MSRLTLTHTKLLNSITKLFELGSQRLLKAIKSLAKTANLTLLPLWVRVWGCANVSAWRVVVAFNFEGMLFEW